VYIYIYLHIYIYMYVFICIHFVIFQLFSSLPHHDPPPWPKNTIGWLVQFKCRAQDPNISKYQSRNARFTPRISPLAMNLRPFTKWLAPTSDVGDAIIHHILHFNYRVPAASQLAHGVPMSGPSLQDFYSPISPRLLWLKR
jgi:hypothetical protein